MRLKRWIRWVKRLALLLVITVVFTAGLNLLVVMETRGRIEAPEMVQQADCIIVLGCGLFSDGTPGRMLTNRLDTAIDLYKRGAATKLLMSGDHGQADYDEVNAMKRYAVEHGVPADAVFMDHAGFSTYETMKRAKEIFGCEQVIIVTQSYHLYRSLWDAAAMGMQVQGVAAAMYPYGWRYNSYLYVREIMARVKDVAWCLLDPPAAIMGTPVSMQGSGSITDDETTKVWLQQLAAP